VAREGGTQLFDAARVSLSNCHALSQWPELLWRAHERSDIVISLASLNDKLASDAAGRAKDE
jgi:hypothetical protein